MYNIQELESLRNEIVKNNRENFLRKEAKKVIKNLKKDKTLRINRHVILLKSCLKELGKTLDYNKFDQLLTDYRNETIH
jgi:predicted metal-dependent RNase